MGKMKHFNITVSKKSNTATQATKDDL